MRWLLFLSVILLAGCATGSDPVEERQRGQVLVCHNDSQTITVSNADYLRHIDHGDSAGPCAYER